MPTGDSKIFVFDKSSSRSFSANIRDTAQKNRYYDNPKSINPSEMESKLSALESTCAALIERIVSKKTVDDFSLAIEIIQEDPALSRPLSMEFR